mgnify:CR=1 FL=1
MKYLLYRSFGNLEKDVKKHELVAVEYGKDIDDVADALMMRMYFVLHPPGATKDLARFFG